MFHNFDCIPGLLSIWGGQLLYIGYLCLIDFVSIHYQNVTLLTFFKPLLLCFKPVLLLLQIIEIYVPFVVNLLLVIFLIINLRKTRSSMAKSIQDDNTAAREREHRKIGVMLIAIVIWFITCNIPA